MERVHQFADHAPRLRLILSGHGTGEVTLCSRVLDHRRIVVRRSRACISAFIRGGYVRSVSAAALFGRRGIGFRTPAYLVANRVQRRQLRVIPIA